MKLREIPEQLEALTEEYNSEECSDQRREEIEGLLETLELTAIEKAEAIANLISHYESEAECRSTEISRLAKLSKADNNKAEWLRNYLTGNVQALGGKVDTPNYKLSLRKSSAVNVMDLGLIPGKYLREIPAKFEADKTTIKKALEAGEEIPGASIETRFNLQIK